MMERFEFPTMENYSANSLASLARMLTETRPPSLTTLPSTLSMELSASRTDAGRESNALENVGDQIWSAAATALLRLARRVLAGRNFAAGLVELGFYFIGQFKPVFKIVVNPVADFFDFRARQLRNRSLNFFNRAHGEKLPYSCWFEKPCLQHLHQPSFVEATGFLPAFPRNSGLTLLLCSAKYPPWNRAGRRKVCRSSEH